MASKLKLAEEDFLALQAELLKLKEETYEAKLAAKKSLEGACSPDHPVGLGIGDRVRV